MSGLNASSGWTHLLAGFLVAGAGIGMINPALASTSISVVPPERSGMASGINNTFRQVGIATGIAGLGAIFQHQLATRTAAALARSGQAHAVLAATHGQLRASFATGGTGALARALPPGPRTALVQAFHRGFAGSLNEILVVATVLAAVGAVLGLALVRGSDFVQSELAPAAAPAG
jgi:hypothetical protein